MGGYGSGRYYRCNSKETTEGLKNLDVNRLNRNDYLKAGHWSSIHWSCGGKSSGNISMHSDGVHLVLDYKIRLNGGKWEDVTEHIRISWTTCHYGGRRPWFICPGIRSGLPCQRRVGKLYSVGKYFLCRHCGELAYESQQESEGQRALRKAQNILVRLGGTGALSDSFPDKPKGMHWSTYLRLQHIAEQGEKCYLHKLDKWLGLR